MDGNIALCEDNHLIQSQLNEIILEYYNEKDIEINIDLFSNGYDFLNNIENKNYAFVLMDIDLEESNGIEIAKEFRESIVFPIHVFDYLVKPFNKKDITNLLDELTSWIGFSDDKDTKRKPFKTLSGLIYIPIDDILYFEYKERKIEIVLHNSRYEMYGSLKKVKDELSEYHFYFPHSAFIINLDKINNVTRERTIIMEDGYEIPISQTRIKEFKKVYFEYIESKD